MSSIVRYQKFIDAVYTVEISLPVDEQGQRVGQEIATVDGYTYVSLPDGATLPAQPAEITVEPVTVTETVKAEISAASPHVHLINQRVKEMIAQQYSIEDEIKLIRTAPSEEFDIYNDFAEACRQWGRDQKALIGL